MHEEGKKKTICSKSQKKLREKDLLEESDTVVLKILIAFMTANLRNDDGTCRMRSASDNIPETLLNPHFTKHFLLLYYIKCCISRDSILTVGRRAKLI